MSKTLVTGALGFVGGELVRSLMSDARNVSLLVREGRQGAARTKFPNVSEILTLRELIEEPNRRTFETIFHLATVYVYDNSIRDVSNLVDGNITLPATLADVAVRWGNPVSFVNVSTFMQHFEGHEYRPTCLYAATKKAAEDVLAYYGNAHSDFTVGHLVFPHVYGEGDTRMKLLNLLINASKSKLNLQLGSGKQLLDLVHVSDAVSALRSLEHLGTGRWSIGGGEHYSTRELADLFSEISGSKLDISFDPMKDRQFDTFKTWDTAPRLPNWAPSVDLKTWISDRFKEPNNAI